MLKNEILAMKISKVIFSLILSVILFNNSMAMEPDSDDEESYNTDTESVSDKESKKDCNAKPGFAYFLKLPPELQFMILYFDLISIPRGRNIRRRAQTLSMVSTLIKDSLEHFKHEKIWTKLLAAETYVKENSATIVNELLLSATNKNIENIRFLILGNADLIKKNNGDTALISASISGYTEIVIIFIAAGVDLNIKDNDGRTALIWAAMSGYTKRVKILIAAGVDLDIKDNDGRTALMRAAMSGYTEMIIILIAAGVDLNIKNNRGETALILAARIGCTEIVKLLIAAGVDLDIKDNLGRTALICAARNRCTEVVKLLIAAGADLAIKDSDGRTALTAATENYNTIIAEMPIVLDAKSRSKIT